MHNLAYTRRSGFNIDYGLEIEHEIAYLQGIIDKEQDLEQKYPSRWLAIKLLEKDRDIYSKLRPIPQLNKLLEAAEKSASHLHDTFSEDAEVVIADRRYAWINGLVHEVVDSGNRRRSTRTERIDRIVMNRILGIPIFMFMMWLVFKLTTDVTVPLVDWLDGVIQGPISRWVIYAISSAGLGGTWLESLLIDGVISGVGGVLVFVPVLMVLYLALALLEDSGYMARAAFVTDRLMHTMGLHGKSFLPMIVGFGCTVPALYTTRTLDNETDRILTGLMVPFMSCGARLPIYVLFASAFYPENSGGVVFGLYMLGIVTAMLVGLGLKYTIFRSKDQAPFVMELPPYRMPSLRGTWFNIRERTSAFVSKAFSVILVASIVIWLLLAIPVSGNAGFGETEMEDSAYAHTANLAAPLFRPLGFGTWQSAGALLTGIMGKEIIVSTLAQVYGVKESVPDRLQPFDPGKDLHQIGSSFLTALADTVRTIPGVFGLHLQAQDAGDNESSQLLSAIKSGFETGSGGNGRLAALAFMVFALTYTPCLAALLAERAELGTRWMWVSIIGQFVIAWLLAFITYQGGLLLGL